jgi:hypothetical protein
MLLVNTKSRRDVLMTRCYLLLLALCLVLRDQPKSTEHAASPGSSSAVQIVQKKIVLKDEDRLRQDVLAAMALAPGNPFPGNVPWESSFAIGNKGLYPLEALMHYHPPLFLEMCLARYEQEVKGFSAVLLKRERLGGNLGSLEKIEIFFREQPFSVYMNWLEGGEGLTKPQKVLYVKGENNNKLLARGRGVAKFLPVFEKDVDSDEAKQTGRYTLDQFGIYLGTKRSVASMHRADERGELHVEYQGLFQVPEVGGRVCHKFVRKPYVPPEEEGLNELTIYIDQENWLQIGSVLKDGQGQLLAEYYFRDVKINPEFKSDQFTRGAL